MDIKIEKKENSKVLIDVVVNAEELETYYSKSLEEAVANVELQGFRKGKAPAKMVEEKVGESKLLEEAASMAMNTGYIKAIKDNKLNVIGDPNANIKKIARNNPLEFSIEVYVLPEIELPDYKKIASKHKKEEVKVEDKEIEDSLKWLQQSLSKLNPKEGEVVEGDWVDITVKINNEKESRDAFILGKGGLVKELRDGMIGMKKGESKEMDFQLKGQDAKCKITVHEIKTVELKDIDDEFAKMVGPFKDLEELKQNIHNDLLKNKETQFLEKSVSAVLRDVAKEVKVDIPSIIIDKELDVQLEDLKRRVSERGMEFSEYLTQIKKTEEELTNSMRETTEQRIKEYFVLREIQKAENITATDDEIQAELLKTYNMYPNLESSESSVDRERLIEYTKDRIESDKTFKKFEEYLAK